MSNAPQPVTIDFETLGIGNRPDDYPPKPIGVSIKYPGYAPKYYAANRTDWVPDPLYDLYVAVKEAYEWGDGILCQNAKFDVEVAEEWLHLPIPPWEKIHDTMYLIFLDDPHCATLGLKSAAERLLGVSPDEQDAVGEWLISNQPIHDVCISRSKASPHYFGRYISYAPNELVEKYANGDTLRTEAIFDRLWGQISRGGMLAAYDRERQLMPILLEMEKKGLQVDLDKLRDDVDSYKNTQKIVDSWIMRRLNRSHLRIDSGSDLMAAMVEAKVVDSSTAPRTPTGKYQTNKEALLKSVTDATLLAVLRYRASLNTCMRTFMQPWLATALESGGLIYTSWTQVRTSRGKGSMGARTGRLSSTPNFQNIPNMFAPLFSCHGDGLPRWPLRKVMPNLPDVRSYIIPFKGGVFIDRDYSQQEPRILAHYIEGSLLDSYKDDPWLDFHDLARSELEKMGKFYSRKAVKNTNLGIIYGMGIAALADKNGMSFDEAKKLKAALIYLYPGIHDLYNDMRGRAALNMPFRTWGGREYYCEPPKIVDQKWRKFDYRMVNVLIQGSAADCTKEAIIRVHGRLKDGWHIVLNVHDQVTMSVPSADMEEAMEVLRQEMEGIEFSIPMLTEGCVSTTHWGALSDFDKKGVLV